MSLLTKMHKLQASSALAMLLYIASASMTSAASLAGNIGLSSDGSTALEYDADPSTSGNDYYLVDVATGTRSQIASNTNFPDFDVVALSADGKSVIGTYRGSNGYRASFIWSQSTGFVDLGTVGGFSTTANAINADGTVVVGVGSQNSGRDQEAFSWTAGNLLLLGYVGTGNWSSAKAVSADGQTIAGKANIVDRGVEHAFVWTSVAGIRNIDTIYDSSEADFVSKNGSVVAGTGSLSGTTTVFRWTSAGMVNVGNLGGSTAVLNAMSDDGNVLVGMADLPSQDYSAFRYDDSTGLLTDLGSLGGHYSTAKDVNADGSVVVGTSTDSANTSHGFRWTAATGMQTVEEWLTNQGLNLAGETTRSADLVSAKGNVVIGMTENETTYIARVAASGDSSGGTGIIDTSKFLPTVAAVGNVAIHNGVYAADTIMFGAQGEPMRNLLSTGQKSVWSTIDAGHDKSDNAEGGLGLGEFGFGYGIADGVTARFAGGGTYTKQDLDAGGDVRQRGFYLSPEVTADTGHDVYVTVGGYWGRGSIDSHRAYLNGADLDYSDGSTNSQTWGGKIRFDWLNAATIQNTAITPYAALSYAHTKVNAFSEDNGSFPVTYDATEDHATIARIGADFVHPLSDKVRLLAKAEADYQFEDHAASTNGTIIGISNFSLPGEDLKHFWVRGGLGAEFDVSKTSTASLMVNATTQGQDPNFWVRTNFTVKF